jgi:hypothetical protein
MDSTTQKIFAENAGPDDFSAIKDLEDLRVSLLQDKLRVPR